MLTYTPLAKGAKVAGLPIPSCVHNTILAQDRGLIITAAFVVVNPAALAVSIVLLVPLKQSAPTVHACTDPAADQRRHAVWFVVYRLTGCRRACDAPSPWPLVPCWHTTASCMDAQTRRCRSGTLYMYAALAVRMLYDLHDTTVVLRPCMQWHQCHGVCMGTGKSCRCGGQLH